MKNIIDYLNNAEHNNVIALMKTFENNSNTPQIGIFWFDKNENDLFFVKTCDYNLQRDGVYNHLHKDIWKKEYFRVKARNKQWNYDLDYKNIPRGRVNYDINSGKFIVCVGEWINGVEDILSDLIKEYFNLNEFEFKKDNIKI